MIVGTVRLLGGSSRWLPPFLLVLVWVLFALANPGSSHSNHVGTFGGLVIFALWLSVTIGNLDDDPHRDLVVAAAGSAGRLHAYRAAAAALGAGTVAMLAAAAATATGTEADKQVIGSLAAGVALGAAAVLIGVGVGTWLHRPILRHRGAATLLALVAVTATMLLPPLQAALRAVSDGRASMAVAVLAAAATWAVTSVVAAARAAGSFAR